MNKYIVGSCVLLSIVSFATAETPGTFCVDMLPFQDVQPQTSPFPYQVMLSKSAVRPGDKVTINLTARPDEEFKGFLIQARVGDTPVGEFGFCHSYKLIDCGSGKANAAAQNNRDAKSSVQLSWTAPADLSEPVHFYTTIVKNDQEFWAKQPVGVLPLKN